MAPMQRLPSPSGAFADGTDIVPGLFARERTGVSFASLEADPLSRRLRTSASAFESTPRIPKPRRVRDRDHVRFVAHTQRY